MFWKKPGVTSWKPVTEARVIRVFCFEFRCGRKCSHYFWWRLSSAQNPKSWKGGQHPQGPENQLYVALGLVLHRWSKQSVATVASFCGWHVLTGLPPSTQRTDQKQREYEKLHYDSKAGIQSGDETIPHDDLLPTRHSYARLSGGVKCFLDLLPLPQLHLIDLWVSI